MTSRPGDIDDMRRLGLGSGASLADAKDAWRRAASRLHPDRAGPTAGGDLAEVKGRTQAGQAAEERLGVFVQDPTAEERQELELPEHGVLVQRVDEGPAHRAGVREGDAILMLNNGFACESAHIEELDPAFEGMPILRKP